MQQSTIYPDINMLLQRLLSDMQVTLGDKLAGLYLYGSAVAGDFLAGVSDVDLLAAIYSDLDPAEFDALDTMHDRLVRDTPQWEGRIEIAYLSLHGLRTFKTQSSRIGIISPGEPFHIIDAGNDWSVNWYMVQEIGVTLFGPEPTTIIEPISKAEFIEVVKNHALGWRNWVKDIRDHPGQSYAIITMCRALYTVTHGQQVSKVHAATWAAQELPEWSSLIRDALRWRETSRDAGDERMENSDSTLAEAQRFVNFMSDQVLL